MEWTLIIKSLLSLVFVLGLMFVTIWSIKYCQLHASKAKILGKIKSKSRVKIVENKKIDLKNSVVLIECDSQEYLVLLSQSQVVILNDDKTKNIKKGKKDEA